MKMTFNTSYGISMRIHCQKKKLKVNETQFSMLFLVVVKEPYSFATYINIYKGKYLKSAHRLIKKKLNHLATVNWFTLHFFVDQIKVVNTNTYYI